MRRRLLAVEGADIEVVALHGVDVVEIEDHTDPRAGGGTVCGLIDVEGRHAHRRRTDGAQVVGVQRPAADVALPEEEGVGLHDPPLVDRQEEPTANRRRGTPGPEAAVGSAEVGDHSRFGTRIDSRRITERGGGIVAPVTEHHSRAVLIDGGETNLSSLRCPDRGEDRSLGANHLFSRLAVEVAVEAPGPSLSGSCPEERHGDSGRHAKCGAGPARGPVNVCAMRRIRSILPSIHDVSILPGKRFPRFFD